MKRLGGIVTAACLLGAFPPLATELWAERPGNQVKVGRGYFVQYCGSCHGKDGRGNGPVAKELRSPPADLTRIAARREGRFPAGELAAYIDGRTVVAAHGTREMPVWGQRFSEEFGRDSFAEEVTRGRLDILVRYLKSIQATKIKEGLPGTDE